MNHTEPQLSPDTQAILLLCSALGKKTEKRDIQPLTTLEYAWLAQWLHEQQLRPADLLDPAVATTIQPIAYHNITANRLLTLLMRKPAMVTAVETWAKQGFWVLSRGDKTYPARLKTRLGHAAPPLLYGIGPSILLQKGGLAIVGTRNTQKEMIDFTKRLTKVAAHQGITILSGGIRGINTEAISTALAQGRCAVGILADGLAKAAISSKYRDALQEERLLLLSPFDPQTGFNVGNILASHKYVYALSDWAVVVNSDFEPEGSWAGAMENLRAGWTPLWVRQDRNSVGNQQLLSQGAMALDSSILEHTSDLREYLQQSATNWVKPTPPPVATPTSFPETKVAEAAPSAAIGKTVAVSPNRTDTETQNVEETKSPPQQTSPSKVRRPTLAKPPKSIRQIRKATKTLTTPEKTEEVTLSPPPVISPPPVTELPVVKPPKSIQKLVPEPDKTVAFEQTKAPPDLFATVWPHLESQLKTEITEDELAKRLNLHPGQVKQWLKRAMKLGKVEKFTKPVRYVNTLSPTERQPSLF